LILDNCFIKNIEQQTEPVFEKFENSVLSFGNHSYLEENEKKRSQCSKEYWKNRSYHLKVSSISFKGI
jgi:hypothetical protein